MQEVETMSKYEYMLEQTEVIKKKVMEAGSTKEAVKYGLRIEIRAEYPKNKESFCVLGIYKPKSDFLDDKKKLQAEPIINHLISIAKEYDQTAQEARKLALSLHEDIRTINRHIQEIKKIQKKLQNNHIINEITYVFFQTDVLLKEHLKTQNKKRMHKAPSFLLPRKIEYLALTAL